MPHDFSVGAHLGDRLAGKQAAPRLRSYKAWRRRGRKDESWH